MYPYKELWDHCSKTSSFLHSLLEVWAGGEMEGVAAEVLCPVFTQMVRDMGRGELWSKTTRPWM